MLVERRQKLETLEEISAEKERAEKEIHYWENREKILEHQALHFT